MIYLIVILCAIVLFSMIYRYDMYDREPWYLMLLALILGGFSAWCMGFVEDWTINSLGLWDSVFGISMNAALYEETCKVVVILIIAFGFRKHFNDPMDGIVYGALAGLGFALEESRFYLSIVPHMIPKPTTLDLFGQESIRLILHFVTGGLDGFGIGFVWMKVRQGKIILPTWISASVAIHFLWDYACGMPQDADAVFQRSVAVLLMLFGLVLFGVAVYVGNVTSKTFHPPQDGERRRLVGWPFSLFFKQQLQ